MIRSPKTSRAPTVTKMGARFVSNVALATVVNCSDQCQMERSPVKNRPATASRPKSRRLQGWRNDEALFRSLAAHHQRNGNANSSRRSEEHTSELQSRPHLVCRLLL